MKMNDIPMGKGQGYKAILIDDDLTNLYTGRNLKSFQTCWIPNANGIDMDTLRMLLHACMGHSNALPIFNKVFVFYFSFFSSGCQRMNLRWKKLGVLKLYLKWVF